MNRVINSSQILLYFLLMIFLMSCNGGADPTPTYSISGKMSGDVLSGVTITLTGGTTTITTTTDASGNFSFKGKANGTYTITPFLQGYTFSPTISTVTLSGASVTDTNFTATATSISGAVSGDVLSGIAITLSGTGLTTTTDASGNYSFSGIMNGNYTVSPSLTGYTFSPTISTITVSGASITGIIFTATATEASTISKVAVPLTSIAAPRICTWRQDKTAAYTVTFDDSCRSSHYLVSAPELEARGMRGTFFLNPKGIVDWSPWQKLFDSGHEIASHGWSHLDMTYLDETTLNEEFGNAKNDLLTHIQGMKSVPSFAYPYGNFSTLAQSIAMLYHDNARGKVQTLNAAVLSLKERFSLNGIIPWTPPYQMNLYQSLVDDAINKGSWIILIFHSVSADEESAEGIIPLSLFREHLDYVAGQGAKLWIATEGDVAAYIRARQSATLESSINEQSILEVSILSNQVPANEEVNLTVAIPCPAEWIGHKVVMVADGLVLNEPAVSSNLEIICDVPVNRKVWLWARK